MWGMHKTIKVSIIGASGYTGVELIRLLLNHPSVSIKQLIAENNAGQPIGNIYPHLKPYTLPELIKISDADFSEIDVAFCCLPHATSQNIIANLPKTLNVIDLSADFRLKDTKTYAKWYGTEHKAPDLQEEAIYGLPEIFRDRIKQGRIIACPGCYPTGATLPLFPLIKGGLIESNDIIIDAKTGVTGAGRATKQNFLFTEINEGIKPYSICQHRHIPEIEQTLSIAAGNGAIVNFTPQLLPMSRGILSTIYVKLVDGVKVSDLREKLTETYKDEPFIQILDEDELPSTRDVYNTNNCHIAISRARTKDRAILVSAIDNLTKGSSGQAIQNMNLLFDLEENQGLNQIPVFP